MTDIKPENEWTDEMIEETLKEWRELKQMVKDWGQQDIWEYIEENIVKKGNKE